jgi:CheY-like chemotaxis protein
MNERLKILVVEDNPGDVRLLQETLKEGKFAHTLSIDIASDGVKAINYLRKDGEYAASERPDLIILDLNLPKKDGREVLKEIKEDADFRTIPVIILTTSIAEQDVMKAYGLYANCYINKPTGLTEYIEVVRAIEEFWFNTVRLPSE